MKDSPQPAAAAATPDLPARQRLRSAAPAASWPAGGGWPAMAGGGGGGAVGRGARNMRLLSFEEVDEDEFSPPHDAMVRAA